MLLRSFIFASYSTAEGRTTDRCKTDPESQFGRPSFESLSTWRSLLPPHDFVPILLSCHRGAPFSRSIILVLFDCGIVEPSQDEPVIYPFVFNVMFRYK